MILFEKPGKLILKATLQKSPILKGVKETLKNKGDHTKYFLVLSLKLKF